MVCTDFSNLSLYMGTIFAIKNSESTEIISLYQKLNCIFINVITKIINDDNIKNKYQNELLMQQNLLKNGLSDILQNLFEPNFEYNTNPITKLINLNKFINKSVLQKINKLVDIITNPWYEISANDNYNDLCMFFFSKFISLHRKMNSKNNTELNKIIQKINIINRVTKYLIQNSNNNSIMASEQMIILWSTLRNESDINKRSINLLIELCHL